MNAIRSGVFNSRALIITYKLALLIISAIIDSVLSVRCSFVTLVPAIRNSRCFIILSEMVTQGFLLSGKRSKVPHVEQ